MANVHTLVDELKIDQIDPDVQTAGAISSAWLDMQDYQKILAVCNIGTLGASATYDAKFEQATSAGGAGVKDMTRDNDGTTTVAIAQQTQAGTDASDSHVQLDTGHADLDEPNGFRWVRLTATVGTATSDTGATVLRYRGRNFPQVQT